ncbi:MAG: hypothetical protein ABIH68_05070, partial [bacterium]
MSEKENKSLFLNVVRPFRVVDGEVKTSRYNIFNLKVAATIICFFLLGVTSTFAADIDLGIEITEIWYDGTSDAGTEFVECYNYTGSAIDIDADIDYLYSDDNAAAFDTIGQRAGWGDITSIPNATFFVICEPDSTYVFETFFSLTANTGEYVGLASGALTLEDAEPTAQVVLCTDDDAGTPSGTIYQNFWYPDNAISNGGSIEKTDFDDDEDVSDSWTDTPAGLDNGTPLEAGDTIVPSGGGGDNLAPAGISSLSALVGLSDGTVRLKWLDPGDDGTGGGNVSSYEVKYATFCIDSPEDYTAATLYEPSPPWSTGTFGTEHEIKTVSGLINATTYWFAIKATDDSSNEGIWPGSYGFGAYTGETIDDINCYYAVGALDLTSPCAISNLTAIAGEASGTVQLKWTAPGNDG